MLTEYIQAAMRHATYKLLSEEEGFLGEIPPCQGVWSNAATLEQTRTELQEVLEDWILIGLKLNHKLPVIDAIDLNVDLSPATEAA